MNDFLLGGRKFGLKVFVLSLQLLHLLGHLIWRVADNLVYVDYRLDLFGFGSEVQCLFGLLIVVEGLTHSAYNGGHRVPRQSLLQDTSEFRVSEVYELAT